MPAEAARSPSTCPFCGLVCDDVVVNIDPSGDIESHRNLCDRALSEFTVACRASAERTLSPRIGSKPVDYDAAVAETCDKLSRAEFPLIGGLMTDVAGTRAAIKLAEKTNAVVDHVNSAAMLRNLRVMQRSGWFTTTLTEVRNRADLVVMIGGGIDTAFPRLGDRVLWPQDSFQSERLARRRVVTLLGADDEPSAVRGGIPHDLVTVRGAEYPTLINQLRALLSDNHRSAKEFSPALTALAQDIKTRDYVVFVWSAGLLDPCDADLTIDALCKLINHLNETQRAAGLPLAGTLGDLTAHQVMTWQTGVGMRTAFIDHTPRQDVVEYDARRLLKAGYVDVVIWLSALSASHLPPASAATQILIGHPALNASPCDIFIPVAVPGVAAPGHLFRTDGVVSLPLRSIATNFRHPHLLPTTADIIARIVNGLSGR